MGAVTSTVCFLLNSVTLGQVKAGTSSFITLVPTYLSTRCSVCVEDLDSKASNVGPGIWMGRGEYSKPVPAHTLALWFPNLFPFRTPERQTKCPDQLHPLYTHVHALGPPFVSRPSLPTWFSSLNGSRNFLLCKISAVYSLE